MYSQLKVHVPERYHERIKGAVTKDHPLSIKLDLTKDGEQVVLLTPGQLLKITLRCRINRGVPNCRGGLGPSRNLGKVGVCEWVQNVQYNQQSNFQHWLYEKS